MSITTRTGDRGRTRLASGKEVDKDAPVVAACGDLDELVSILGVARCQVRGEDARRRIERIQRALLALSVLLASGPRPRRRVPEFGAGRLAALTRTCAALERRAGRFRGPVLPGGNLAAACLDYARAVARRCERQAVGLFRSGELTNRHVLAWLNRLSDCLWLMARLEEQPPHGD